MEKLSEVVATDTKGQDAELQSVAPTFDLPNLPAPVEIAPSPPVLVPSEQPAAPDPFAWSDIKDIVRMPNGYQCSVKFHARDTYVTFLACADDVEAHGRAIHEKCDSGVLGKVPDYFPTDAELLDAAQERVATELRRANAAVTKYQDRVDVNRATDADTAALLAWKNYRVDLNNMSTQQGWPTPLTWPKAPQ